LRSQPHALAQRRLARIVARFRIEGCERGRGRAQHIHRMAVFGRADDIEHRRGQLARRLELGVEACELLLGRQFAVEQEPCGLFEAGMFGEIVNRIAAIAQLAGVAVDKGAR
jgi:hypothetical protein